MVLYRVFSRCGLILQGVRALKYKRKAYTTEGKVFTLTLESKGFQGNGLAVLT